MLNANVTRWSVLILISIVLLGTTATVTIAHEKVVVVPLNSSTVPNAMQGHGRPGVELMTHTVLPNGHCTGPTGVNFALSKSLETWGSAASVCPADTWVCSSSDLPTSGSCNVPPISYHLYLDCDGTASPFSQTALLGWISDRYNNTHGILKASDGIFAIHAVPACQSYRVWCCWK